MTWLLVTRCPLWPSFSALSLFPGIHIAQFPFQVIGNCGVIFLTQCSIREEFQIVRVSRSLAGSCSSTRPLHKCGWRCVQYDGIVVEAATNIFRVRPGGEFDDGRVA